MAYYDDDLEECRICFDIETEKNKFISPCRCSGTSKFVHIKCINKWRRVNKGKDAYIQCMECRENYIIRRKFIVEYYPFELETLNSARIRNMYFCVGFPFGIAFAIYDKQHYLVDLLNGGTQEPYTKYCGIDVYTNKYNCTNSSTLKQTLSTQEGMYVGNFFYMYFIFNVQSLFLCLYIFYRVYKNIHRKMDYIIEGGWFNLGWLIFLFKYILLYKCFITVLYSPWGLLSWSITGVFFEPFTYILYEKTNRKIIKRINSSNPETIQNWSEEVARREAYDFSPIQSPTGTVNGTVELEEISIESSNSSEYETVSNEDTEDEVEEKEEEPIAYG
jgi:hypothetical protein